MELNEDDFEHYYNATRRLSKEIVRLRQSLEFITKMPCITELLGESPEDNGGCTCASCVAKAALATIEEKP